MGDMHVDEDKMEWCPEPLQASIPGKSSRKRTTRSEKQKESSSNARKRPARGKASPGEVRQDVNFSLKAKAEMERVFEFPEKLVSYAKSLGVEHGLPQWKDPWRQRGCYQATDTII